MKQTWDRIEAWLKSNAPDLLRGLNPPAKVSAFAQLQELLGLQLPDDVRESYLIHDGQPETTGGLINATILLSLEEIGRQWSIWKELLDDGTFSDAHSQSPDGVKSDWWSPGWIPITHDGGGNHHCLDLDPAPGGQVGQIISFWHDDAERTILAPSFSAWLAAYADALERGDKLYSDDYGGIVDKDDA